MALNNCPANTAKIALRHLVASFGLVGKSVTDRQVDRQTDTKNYGDRHNG